MPEQGDVLTQREVLEVTNEDTIPLVLVLEPWAESYLIPPRTTVDVVAFAPGEGRLEVDDADSRLVVWGWTGSSVHVIRDGQELEPEMISSAEAAQVALRRTLLPFVRQRTVSPGT